MLQDTPPTSHNPSFDLFFFFFFFFFDHLKPPFLSFSSWIVVSEFDELTARSRDALRSKKVLY